MKPEWQASEPELMAELVRLAEQFVDSNHINITPALFNQDKKKKRLVIALNMTRSYPPFLGFNKV